MNNSDKVAQLLKEINDKVKEVQDIVRPYGYKLTSSDYDDVDLILVREWDHSACFNDSEVWTDLEKEVDELNQEWETSWESSSESC